MFNMNEPLGAKAPPLVGGGGARKGGGVGIPRAHDRYIVNAAFTLYYHKEKPKIKIKIKKTPKKAPQKAILTFKDKVSM